MEGAVGCGAVLARGALSARGAFSACGALLGAEFTPHLVVKVDKPKR